MKKLTIILSIAFSLILLSCGTSIDVSYDYDKSVDFSKYKTFKLADWNNENSKLVDEFTKQRMLNAMRNQFIARGYSEVDENPDVILDLFLVTDTETYTTAYTTHMGGYGTWGGYGGWYRPYYGYNTGISSTQYVEKEKLLGTIVLDVFDDRAKRLVWQGIGKGEIKKNSKLTESAINSIFDKIYYKYPVKKR